MNNLLFVINEQIITLHESEKIGSAVQSYAFTREQASRFADACTPEGVTLNVPRD